MAKQKMLSSTCKIFAGSLVLSFTMFSTVFGAALGRISGTAVNVRTDSTNNSSVLTKFHLDQTVSILSEEGDFFKISYDDGSAYVARNFVTLTSAPGTVNTDEVNIRAAAGDDSNIVGQLYKGSQIEIVGKEGEFYRFEYSGYESYIHENFVDTDYKNSIGKKAESASESEPTYANVIIETACLHKESNSESTTIELLKKGRLLDVVSTSDPVWIKVKTDDSGIEGYIHRDEIDMKTGEKPVNKIQGEQIVAYAKQFIGTPYVYGGTNLRSGVDCSGFVYSVYKNFGITLNRTSKAMPQNGVAIKKADLIPGDLIFFGVYGSAGIGHVGIYIGDNKFIHSASGGGVGVSISSLSESYFSSNYRSSARILS